MNITNEKTTSLEVNIPRFFNQEQFKDNDVLFSEPGFTDNLLITDTRYGKFNYFRGDGIIGASLTAYGEYTQYEINLLSHVLGSETVVYDIGGNCGYHALGFASKAKHVYSFEPNNKNYKLLQLNTHKLDNVTTYNYGVSDKNVDSHIEDFTPGILNNYGELHIGDTGQPCKLVKLDDFIKQEKMLAPHVVKIDVEGHEYEVLMGMDHTIRHNHPVIFYEHQHGDHLPEIYDYLTGLAYTIYWFACPNYNPTNFKNNKINYFENNPGVVNAFAVPFHIRLNTNLMVKSHRDETYNEAVEKHQKQNAKD